MAGRRRHFGRVRQLNSGRWQVRYAGPGGIDRPGPRTFLVSGASAPDQAFVRTARVDAAGMYWIIP
jgi:hypothetical protein